MERLLATLVSIFILIGSPLQAAASSYTHYRLPVAIQPDLYHLKIITHLENAGNLTFDGHVSIRFLALEDTNNITFHVQNLTVDESRTQLKSYDDADFHLCLEGVDMVPELDYYIIRLCQTLVKGHMYQVNLPFSGILNEKLFGYYRSSYVDDATNEARWLSVTQFEPAYARAAFPCLDEPSYKAKFIIWLGHHKSLTALSNMPLEKQIALDGLKEFVWSIFEESVPMSTYLVAYTVNDFGYKESRIEGSDVVFRTWSRLDYVDRCEYATEVGPILMKYYEELFGIPFPLKKIDAIAIPDFTAAGMENWGLITYQEPFLLFSPNVTSQMLKASITRTIAHELAHQWFGNLVTMKWWSDLWLNEGFATYIASLGLLSLSPDHEEYNIESLSNSLEILRIDAKLTSHPISQPIFNTSQIHERFDSISYKKGSTVLRMVHMLMGQDAFFEGVRNYLTKNKYQNAEQDDLWAAFTETAHKFNRIKPQHEMKTIMDSWTVQTGYPLVTVIRNYETGAIEISQRRFLKNSTISDEEATKCWWVPLSYTTTSEMDFNATGSKIWLECDESGKSVPLKLDNVADANEWIIFNIQLSGVYRVMYDSDNWKLIANTLKSDKFVDIHVMNRAQILTDVTTFAWSGYQGYDITFNILEYLTREREFLPWKAAGDGISNVYYLVQCFPQYTAYLNTYMRYISEPTYYYVGGLNNTETTNTRALMSLKTLVSQWACIIELDDCVQTAINYFKQWQLSKNPHEENTVPLDLRYTIYCTALRHGDENDWAFLWQRYMESNDPLEQIIIGMSLGCSRNETVLKNALEMIFDKGQHVSQEDALIVFEAIASNNIGVPIAQEYLEVHLSSLSETFNAVHLIAKLSISVVSTEGLNKLSKIIDENKDYLKNSEKRVQAVFESINFRLQWIERNLEHVISDLQTRLASMGIIEDNVIDTYM